MNQKARHSFLEACLSTAIGFIVAFLANLVILPTFGFMPSFSQNLYMTIFFTLVSVIRGYWVRRLFNWLHSREYL